MGIFDSWKVVFTTTSFAKESQIFYFLAEVIDSEEEEIYPKEVMLSTANAFLYFKNSFDAYFDAGIRKEKNEAVKFLVAFTSFSMGKDRIYWSWEKVRHHAQGLYGSMEESPAHFLHYNTPLINRATFEINNFINSR
jgi:hypothetical protein